MAYGETRLRRYEEREIFIWLDLQTILEFKSHNESPSKSKSTRNEKWDKTRQNER